jgi:crotonobetainyl-CoA:carnitine CoA-transferase CaiB-like acyl-CoA transferase
VAIVGHPSPDDELPGHDLTYQAQMGLLEPPALPRACIADFAGAQEVVGSALALLLARQLGQGSNYAQVSLAKAAEFFAEALRHGLTSAGGPLGGGLPGYNLYQARDGWIAIAALEPHFWRKLQQELGLTDAKQEDLQRVFQSRTASEWEAWAEPRDLPIVFVHQRPAAESRGPENRG